VGKGPVRVMPSLKKGNWVWDLPHFKKVEGQWGSLKELVKTKTAPKGIPQESADSNGDGRRRMKGGSGKKEVEYGAEKRPLCESLSHVHQGS